MMRDAGGSEVKVNYCCRGRAMGGDFTLPAQRRVEGENIQKVNQG